MHIKMAFTGEKDPQLIVTPVCNISGGTSTISLTTHHRAPNDEIQNENLDIGYVFASL